jgi:integrase
MSENKVPFTAGRVSKFVCEAGKAASFLWDTESTGLGLKASAGGSKVYVLQSRLESGASVRLTIGSTKAWTLGAARDEARRLQVLIDSGIDPRQEKRDRIAAAEAKRAEADAKRIELERIAAPAMEAWQKYIEARAPRWSQSHLGDHATVSKEGGSTAPKGADPARVTRLCRASCARCWRFLWNRSTLTACASGCKMNPPSARPIPALPSAAARLPELVLRPPRVPRPGTHRRLHHAHGPRRTAEEIRQGRLPATRATAGMVRRRAPDQNPVIAAYLQTALLTGARREEVASIRWEDVDFQWKALTIKDKVEGERTIPLTPYVASLLAALPRRNEWVFSSPTAASGRLQEPRIMHNKALTAAGLPALSIHGLRRSFGTLAEWVECPAGVSAQIMGHKPSATAEKHYRVRPLDLLRQWHTKIEGWILDQAGIEQPAEDRGHGLRVVA